MTPPVFGVVGWKNSGKTTLMAKLIANLAARGLEVGAVKHAHHSFEIDQEGRDSYRYRQAGAETVAISSVNRFAIMSELRGAPEPKLSELVRHMAGVDLILVEGFRREAHPKLEVRRRDALQTAPLAPEDPSILAIAADFEVEGGGLPVFDLDSTEAIAEFILATVLPQAAKL